jgi:NADPH-dependent 2,4-dienoyl-CoA reductase/sulfur reductase-like enzyme
MRVSGGGTRSASIAASAASSAATESAAATESDGGGKTAVVVGAGPAGALTALYLANQGWHVRVYEARPAPTTPSDASSSSSSSPGRPADRSYNIVLSPRGLGALQGAGVTLPEDGVVQLVGLGTGCGTFHNVILQRAVKTPVDDSQVNQLT